MKKSIAVALYVVYSVFITFFIVYGGPVSNYLIEEGKVLLYAREITDVEVNIDTETPLLFGVRSYPIYTPIGDFYNAGLTFESLDPDILEVSASGALYAYNNHPSDTAQGRVLIRSKYDRKFEKIITFRFCKRYPETFTTSYVSKSHSIDGTVSVGIPVYVYPTIPKDVTYNVSTYEIVYDETYFTRREDGAVLPIAPTPEGVTTAFTIRYANGAEATSDPVSVRENTEAAVAIDEIRLDAKPSDSTTFLVNQTVQISLFHQGKQVYDDYTVTFGKEDRGYTNPAYAIGFQSPGEKTVTITLQNGFSASFPIAVRNRLALPELQDTELAKTHHISILESELPRYYYTFPKDVTDTPIRAVRHDETMVYITATQTYLAIEPRRPGTTNFSLLVSDGYEYLWMDFTLEIREDTSLSFFLIDNVGKIITKYIGHLTLFVILSWFALNMFRYIKTKNVVFRFLRYTMCALPIAAVTEYWQTFLPQRTGSVEDALVDMGSYYLGTLIALCAVAIYRTCKKRRAQQTTRTPALHEGAETLQ